MTRSAKKQALQGLIPIRLLDAYGYMASMAVMPEGHRDHKVDIPKQHTTQAKKPNKGIEKLPKLLNSAFEGWLWGKCQKHWEPKKLRTGSYVLLAQGFKRSLKGFNSPFKDLKGLIRPLRAL